MPVSGGCNTAWWSGRKRIWIRPRKTCRCGCPARTWIRSSQNRAAKQELVALVEDVAVQIRPDPSPCPVRLTFETRDKRHRRRTEWNHRSSGDYSKRHTDNRIKKFVEKIKFVSKDTCQTDGVYVSALVWIQYTLSNYLRALPTTVVIVHDGRRPVIVCIVAFYVLKGRHSKVSKIQNDQEGFRWKALRSSEERAHLYYDWHCGAAWRWVAVPKACNLGVCRSFFFVPFRI